MNQLSPRLGETATVDNTHWGNLETWVYTGQVYSPTPYLVFAGAIDDTWSVSIDGRQDVLVNGYTTRMRSAP